MCPVTTQPPREEPVVLPVHVVPGADRNEIAIMEGKTLKIRVTAPPMKGKANKALVKLLAKALGLQKNQVEIVSGHRARRKMIRVEGIDEDALLDLLHRLEDKKT